MTGIGIVYPKSANIEPAQKIGYGNNQENQQSLFFNESGQPAQKEKAFIPYENKIKTQNALVKRHEEAHKSGAGPQASGSPVYETKTDQDGREIITGGHQMINVPSLINPTASREQIEKTKEAAQYTIKGAEAPAGFDELSAADRSVAEKGRAVLSSAKAAMAERNNLEARLVKFNGDKNVEGELSSQQLTQAKQSEEPPEKQHSKGSKFNLLV
ncbi:MAG TPA: hypothetical protein P5556_05215 [Candidatus Gastranaerophilales bacterium]|nr:hypothetical protein [Candidatus Gastranaerophilales bacterium]